MTQFEIDLNTTMNIQGSNSTLAYYNLVTTKRDIHLYCVGIKPNRNFKFNEVKKYFGLKGNKFEVNTQLREMVNRYQLGEYTTKKV